MLSHPNDCAITNCFYNDQYRIIVGVFSIKAHEKRYLSILLLPIIVCAFDAKYLDIIYNNIYDGVHVIFRDVFVNILTS